MNVPKPLSGRGSSSFYQRVIDSDISRHNLDNCFLKRKQNYHLDSSPSGVKKSCGIHNLSMGWVEEIPIPGRDKGGGRSGPNYTVIGEVACRAQVDFVAALS